MLASKIYRFFKPISLVEIYKRMGVEIGGNCKFQFDVVLDYSHYWLIKIGNNVTLAPRVHILSHDASTKNHLGYSKLGITTIADNVFIGAGTIVLPGVSIGENSIIGAGSVVTQSIPPNTVAVGNPAKAIKSTFELLDKEKNLMTEEVCFNELYTIRRNISEKKKKEMIEIIKKYGYAYVE